MSPFSPRSAGWFFFEKAEVAPRVVRCRMMLLCRHALDLRLRDPLVQHLRWRDRNRSRRSLPRPVPVTSPFTVLHLGPFVLDLYSPVFRLAHIYMRSPHRIARTGRFYLVDLVLV